MSMLLKHHTRMRQFMTQLAFVRAFGLSVTTDNLRRETQSTMALAGHVMQALARQQLVQRVERRRIYLDGRWVWSVRWS